MQNRNETGRHVSLAIVLVLLGAILGPFAATVSAEDGGTVAHVLGGGAFFAEPAPVGSGTVLVDLLVPFRQDPFPPINDPGYQGLELTIPPSLIADQAATDLALSVVALAGCPGASANWRPADEACIPLERVAADPEPGQYTVDLTSGTTLRIEPGGSNHQAPMHVSLLVKPPTDINSGTTPGNPVRTVVEYGLEFYSDNWAAGNANVPSSIALPVDEADALGIYFLDGAAETSANDLPQVFRAGDERAYHARGLASGTPLARVFATWSQPSDACGTLGAPGADGSVVFIATTATDGLSCQLEASWGSTPLTGTTGDLTVLAGDPDRFVVVVDGNGDEVTDDSIILGAPTTFQLAVYDAHDNSFFGFGVGEWHTDGDCGTIDPTIGPETTFTPTKLDVDHCHVHAVLLEDHGIDDETGELGILPGTTTTIDFAGEATEVGAGVAHQFTATAYNENGYAIPDGDITYSSDTGAITPAGLFQATSGTHQLTAMSGAVTSDPHTVTIVAGPGGLNSIFTVDKASATADGSDTITATIEAIDEFGQPTEGGEDTISVSDGTDTFPASHVEDNIYTVSVTNTVAGSYTLKATVNGKELATTHPVTFAAGALDSITITPDGESRSADAPDTIVYTVTGADANGNPVTVDIADTTWNIDDTDGGTITDNEVTTGTTAGTYTVTAQHTAGPTDTTTFTVTPGVATTATASPDTIERVAGNRTTETFTVEASDQHGNPVVVDAATEVTWTLDDGAGGSFNENVLTPSVVAGTYAIEGTFNHVAGLTVGATLEIVPGAVETISVLPAAINTIVGSGDVFTLDATGADAHANAIQLEDTTEVAWAINNTTAGTMNDNVFTPGTTVGTYHITATLVHTHELPEAVAHAMGEPHIHKNVTVTILPAPADHFVVACDPCSVAAGDVLDIDVRAENSIGQIDPINQELSLTFSNPSASPNGDTAQCAGVDVGTGIAVQFTNGIATIGCTFFAAETFGLKVTDGTLEGESMDIAVAAASFAAVDVTCDTPVQAGSSSTCEAAPLDDFGNPVTAGTAAWTSASGAFSSTTGSPVVYYPPTADGSYPVTATIEGISGSLDVVVAPSDAVSIELNVPYGTIGAADPAVGTFEVIAWVNDTFGNAVHGKTLHWAITKDESAGGIGALNATATKVIKGVAKVTLTTGSTLGEAFAVEVVDDPADPKLIRRSGDITVLPGVLDTIDIVCAADCEATAGGTITLDLTMYDGSGNLLNDGPHAFDGTHAILFGGAATAPAGHVPTCTDADGAEIELGELTNISFVGGSGSVTCTVYANETGTFSVTTRGVTESTSLVVDSATADALRLATYVEGPHDAGFCDTYMVDLVDAFGNLVELGSHTVTFADAGNGKVQTNCAGSVITELVLPDGFATGSFAFVDQTAEVVNLTLSAGTLAGDSLDLLYHPAAAFEFDVDCTGCATAGDAFTLDIAAVDQYGNVLSHGANHYDGTVSLTFTGAAASPSGDVPVCAGTGMGDSIDVTFADGVASVSCTLYEAGSTTLTVTETAGSLTGGHLTTVEALGRDSIVAWLPGMTYDVASRALTGEPTDQTAGTAFALDLLALDIYGNVASDDGTLDITLSGASAAHDGTMPAATDKDGADVDFGTLTTVQFSDGAASTSVVLYLNESAELGLDLGAEGTRTFVAFEVQVGAFGSIGIFDGDPRQCGRGCLVAGPGVSNQFSIDQWDAVTFRAGMMDAYGNLLEQPLTSATWSSAGLSPPIDAPSAAGVFWSPDTPGVGTVTIEKTGLSTVMDVTVNAA